jgi:hypothetical protein
VLAAVAAARDADSGGGQRAEVALELGEVLVAAVAGVDVQDDQAGGTRAPMLACGHHAHQRVTRAGSLVAAYRPWHSSWGQSAAWWGW